MMRLGHKLYLQRAQRLSDGAGGAVIEWQMVAAHWAGVEAQTARAITGEAAPITRNRYTVTMRALPFAHPARPRAGDRFLFGAQRYLAIEAVTELDARGQYLRIETTQEIAQ